MTSLKAVYPLEAPILLFLRSTVDLTSFTEPDSLRRLNTQIQIRIFQIYSGVKLSERLAPIISINNM